MLRLFINKKYFLTLMFLLLGTILSPWNLIQAQDLTC